MAGGMLRRSALSFFARSQPQNSFSEGFSKEILPFTNVVFGNYGFYKRGIQSRTELNNPVREDKDNREGPACPTENREDIDNREGPLYPTDYRSSPTSSDSAVKYNVMSKLKTSARHDLAMVFTCKVCETRSVKLVCRESYEKGVVVVRCGGCNNNHLIVDRLGWFGEPGSIEDLLAARGEEVKKGSIDSLNLTAEDLIGKKS